MATDSSFGNDSLVGNATAVQLLAQTEEQHAVLNGSNGGLWWVGKGELLWHFRGGKT